MTLEEALKILGISIVGSITNIKDFEQIRYYVFNAIVEEWLDGDISKVSDEDIGECVSIYGINAFKQAARVIANKIELYGDIEQ